MSARWWGLVVNGQIEDVQHCERAECADQFDIRGLIECDGLKPPITIEIVPVTVAIEAAKKKAKR